MTKTVAVLLDSYNCQNTLKEYISIIREKTGADKIVAITSGNFTHAGYLTDKNKYEAARETVQAGADLVVELPVYCTWMTADGLAFAAVALMDKMACIDEIALPYTSADEEFIQKLVMYLFMEPVEYQRAFKKYRANGCSIPSSQVQALERCVSGAGKFLSKTVNLLSVEMGKSLKKMYSQIKPAFINLEEFPDHAQQMFEKQNMTESESGYLGKRLADIMSGMNQNQARNYLNEIFGGFDSYSVHLLELLEQSKEKPSFLELAQKLGTAKKTPQDMRAYLLRAILDFRGVDNSICGLNTYVLYVRILGYSEKGQLLTAKMQNNPWLTVLLEENVEKAQDNIASLEEECKERIASFDLKVQILYEEMKKLS